ncbi:hypothetical protein F3J43_18495 [Pantoea sp. Cy-639]|nr:hypothetical protein [Pantoea sp. Cy-639]
MGCLSLGFYFAYWNYRHWLLIRGQRGFKITPLLCTIFGGFTLYFLMRKIVARSRTKHLPVEGSALGVTLMYWIPSLLLLSWELWDPVPSVDGLPFSIILITPLLLSVAYTAFFSVVLIQIQQAANACAGDPLGLQNAQITWTNVLWIVISWIPCAGLIGYVSTYESFLQ